MQRSLSLLVCAAALFAGSCGGTESDAGTAPASTTAAPATSIAGTSTTVPADDAFPVVVASDAGEATLPAAPARIVALSATHVEMLFAIGAGQQVAAGDLFSNHPQEAESLEKLDSFNLSAEAVVALDPDLVILTFDPVDAVDAFAAVGIPTLLLGTATTLDAVYEQILVLGTATGHRTEAEGLVASMQREIEEIVATVGDAGAGLTYYHETDPFSYYTPNSKSFIGQLYALLGMENIADEAPDEFGSGFPQLSPEYIVAADPDIIFLASAGETAETLAARDGWSTMSAIGAGNVHVLDPDVASRWGPRIVELVASVADGVISP